MSNTIGSGPVSHRIAIHEQKINEASGKSETSAPKRFSEAAIKEQAAVAQKTGGVLAEHAVSLQKLAEERKICVCIRAVNPLATGLIKDGFGTKDMSIKAKSSNLPPLNGLIPHDQAYGKKGGDPEAVKAFTKKNDIAIKEGVATKVPAQISAEQIKFLAKETGNLEIHGNFLNNPGESGLMIGKDPKISDKPFHFWGENVDGKIHIFEAKLQDGKYGKGKPVEVMANISGNAVTADYDLAMVAPRMQDYGPAHTSDLKVTSFKEYDALTNITHRMQTKLDQLVKDSKYDEALTLVGDKALIEELMAGKSEKLNEAAKIAANKEYMKGVDSALKKSELEYMNASLTENGTLTQDEARARRRDDMRTAVQGEVLQLLLENLGSENAVFDIVGEPDLLTAYCDHFIDTNPEKAAELFSEHGIETKPVVSRGVTSDFVNDLLKPLNDACDRKEGTEVFHHGADTGNPFSVEADNFPMTVILPREAAGPDGEVVKIIGSPKEFTAFARDLKNAGFQTPLSALWDSDPTLASTRSDRFESARAALEKLVGGGGNPTPVQEPESLDLAAKIRMYEEFSNQKV